MTGAKGFAGLAVGPDEVRAVTRSPPQEAPLAITFNGTTLAVTMATRDTIADFAHGSAMTEGAIGAPGEAGSFEIVEGPHGIEARFSLAGIPAIIATAAPAARARAQADAAGLTLAAFVRDGWFDLCSHPERVQTGETGVARRGGAHRQPDRRVLPRPARGHCRQRGRAADAGARRVTRGHRNPA